MTNDLNMQRSMLTSQGYNLITDISKWKGTTRREDGPVSHNKNSQFGLSSYITENSSTEVREFKYLMGPTSNSH